MLRGIGPITFNACRFPISTVLTIAVQFLMLPKSSSSSVSLVVSRYTISTFKWGIFCGLFIFGGSVLQQIGLLEVQAGKMSFITGSYVIFVPIVEWCLPGFGVHLNCSIWISAVISIIGMYFLSGCVGYENCFKSNENILQSGEMIIFGSMLFWVIVIMATDVAAKEVDCLSLAVVENLVCSVLTIAAAMIFEPDMMKYPYNVIGESWDLIVIVATVEGSAVVFGILGQVYINPSITALISSSASVYTAIGGYVFLGEVLRPVELLGCGLILSATAAASYQIETADLKNSYTSIPV